MAERVHLRNAWRVYIVAAGLIWEDDLFFTNDQHRNRFTTLAVNHCNRRRRWFNVRRILSRGTLACSSWHTIHRRTVGLENVTCSHSKCFANAWEDALRIRCLSCCDVILHAPLPGLWLSYDHLMTHASLL